MTVEFLKEIAFGATKSYYSHSTQRRSLPHFQEMLKFIADNKIQDVCFDPPSRLHNMTVLIVNDYYRSLADLASLITEHSGYAKKYFYLAVNKFYIYSTVDSTKFNNIDDYDVKLVKYCHGVINTEFELIKYDVNSADKGTVGNFVHPATTMFFKRHE